MCEFTVYLNGHEESDIVARNVIKSRIKDGHISLMDSAGKSYRVENACITKVDSIMAELFLESVA
jgi:predicted RNA-binding protein